MCLQDTQLAGWQVLCLRASLRVTGPIYLRWKVHRPKEYPKISPKGFLGVTVPVGCGGPVKIWKMLLVLLAFQRLEGMQDFLKMVEPSTSGIVTGSQEVPQDENDWPYTCWGKSAKPVASSEKAENRREQCELQLKLRESGYITRRKTRAWIFAF